MDTMLIQQGDVLFIRVSSIPKKLREKRTAREGCVRTNAGGLHRDGAAALRYRDGFSVFALNGVLVPEWLATEPDGEIAPRLFAKIENAEVRREFVRKIGMERIVQSLGAEVLDQRDEYELLSIDLGGAIGRWPYLKMLNPSIGTWHLEAVAREIKTVEQALCWRNQSPLQPAQLT